jgi:dTDP-4-dehydrorhamnose reductase
MKRVLVTAGMGMLGHALVRGLRGRTRLGTTVREGLAPSPYPMDMVRVFTGVDLLDDAALANVLDAAPWDVLVNAAGMVKQRKEASDPAATIAANALLPHRLAKACRLRGIRLIHFSTDCVFSGLAASNRGAHGYRETDLPDAMDLYGSSKRLGEVTDAACLTLRTSIVGPELRNFSGLASWFLHQTDASVPGFTRAWFSGIATPVAADLVAALIDEHPDLSGLYHVAAEPISKYDLLQLMAARHRPDTTVLPDAALYCDRRLDGRRFADETGWRAPDWPSMVEMLGHV